MMICFYHLSTDWSFTGSVKDCFPTYSEDDLPLMSKKGVSLKSILTPYMFLLSTQALCISLFIYSYSSLGVYNWEIQLRPIPWSHHDCRKVARLCMWRCLPWTYHSMLPVVRTWSIHSFYSSTLVRLAPGHPTNIVHMSSATLSPNQEPQCVLFPHIPLLHDIPFSFCR